MKHDDGCERGMGALLKEAIVCRCEVRALEAKLAEVHEAYAETGALLLSHEGHIEKLGAKLAEREVVVESVRKQRDAAESRLAALRPLVRAAVEWKEVATRGAGVVASKFAHLNVAIADLDPALIAWAKGGE